MRHLAWLVPLLLALPAVGDDDPLAELLAGGDLARSTHPVAAEFFFGEGQGRLSDSERGAALEQISTSLGRQTNAIGMMMQGMAGMMSSDSMQQMQQSAAKMAGPGAMIKGALGIGPTAAPPDGNAMQADLERAMVDPWVRGMGAADALVVGGQINAAARFYTSCLQMLQAAWVPDACLDGILRLEPQKAEKLLVWMLENAESASMTNVANWGVETPKPDKKAPPDQGMVQLRSAALEGLGALVGANALDAASRERAMAALLSHSQGKDNEIYGRGVAAGLGRSRDPRAVAPLRQLAKRRGDPDAKQEALHGLAVGFRDESAIRQLRGELDDHDPEEQLRAAQALYELGDEAAFGWAVDVIGKRRVMESEKPDIRAQVVRDLVELGGPAARQSLERALAEGAGNDWLGAWVEVGLLELGDTTRVARVEVAIARTDWDLDRRGFRSIWRAIKPFVQAALNTALSGGMGLASPSTMQQIKQATSLIGNFAAGERSRSLAKKGKVEAAVAQLRWQSADAIGAAGPPGGGALLQRLLADEDPAVRLSAASALTRLDQPEALAGLAAAFPLDFGAENGVERTGAVRAALLRSALVRFPDDPRTAELVTAARRDPDGAVRFIALVGARGAPAT